MLKKIKMFYYKNDFNYFDGFVDPLKFHTIFYQLMRAFQAVDKEMIPSWTYPLQIFLAICGMLGQIMSIFAIYRGIKEMDLPFIVEGGTYLILFTVQFMILACPKLNLPQYHNLLITMKEDYEYICTVGQKHRQKFFEAQLVTWQATVWTATLVGGIGVGAVSLATVSLLYFLATHESDDGLKRPLLFPLWSPIFDFGDTPYFEIAFITFNVISGVYAYVYTFFLLIEIVWVREIMVKADLIKWNIEDLLKDIYPTYNKSMKGRNATLLRRRMKTIVSEHVSMYRLTEDYGKVYKILMYFTQELYPYLTAFTAYAAIQKIDEGDVNTILILLCISAMVLVYIPSFLCTMLVLKVTSISDACWGVHFWNAHAAIRPYLVLVMQRSFRPLPIGLACFSNSSLETFSNKTARAYSIFNMLRQMK